MNNSKPIAMSVDKLPRWAVPSADDFCLDMTTFATVAAVIAYAITVSVASLETPNYAACHQLISEMGEAGRLYALQLRLVLVLVGCAVAVQVDTVRRVLPEARLFAFGLASLSLGLILGGIFPCDPQCKPVSFSGWTHILSSAPGSLFSVLGPFVFARLIEARSPRVARLSRVGGYLIVPTTMLAGLLVYLQSPVWQGAAQRLATGFVALWIALLAFAVRNERRS